MLKKFKCFNCTTVPTRTSEQNATRKLFVDNNFGAILANSENDRKGSDFYPTPPNVTTALLDFINDKLLIDTSHYSVCEPACGTGMMSEVLKKRFKKVESFDIRATGYGIQHDFLSGRIDNSDVMITNPPFILAEEFINRSQEYGYKMVALLLKSQYWHSSKRLKLFRKYQPAYILPLTWRPDFLFGERGGAPTMEVLWTLWMGCVTETKYYPLEKKSFVDNK